MSTRRHDRAPAHWPPGTDCFGGGDGRMMETLLFSARDKWPCPRAEVSERRGMKMRPRVAQAGGSGQRSRPRSTPQRVKNRVDVPIPPGRQGRCTHAQRGRGWCLTCWIGELVEASGARLCYQVYPARPASQQPLGGGSAACKPVYLLLPAAPAHVHIAAALARPGRE